MIRLIRLFLVIFYFITTHPGFLVVPNINNQSLNDSLFKDINTFKLDSQKSLLLAGDFITPVTTPSNTPRDNGNSPVVTTTPTNTIPSTTTPSSDSTTTVETTTTSVSTDTESDTSSTTSTNTSTDSNEDTLTTETTETTGTTELDTTVEEVTTTTTSPSYPPVGSTIPDGSGDKDVPPGGHCSIVETVEKIDFETIIYNDPTIPKGTSEIKRPGVPGEKVYIDKICYNGAEETIENKTVTVRLDAYEKVKPIDQLVSVGTKIVNEIQQIQQIQQFKAAPMELEGNENPYDSIPSTGNSSVPSNNQ